MDRGQRQRVNGVSKHVHTTKAGWKRWIVDGEMTYERSGVNNAGGIGMVPVNVLLGAPVVEYGIRAVERCLATSVLRRAPVP